MNKNKALIALLLLVPAPSIGALCGMIIFPDSLLGLIIFAFSKVWILAFPLIWHKFIDKQPISFSAPKQGGFGMGIITGLGITGIITAVYFLGRNALIDNTLLVEKLTEIGLASKSRYLIGALYWITINSVLEEYVWRWFCVKQCEVLMRRSSIAIICSALFFTIHHIIATSVYFGVAAVAICNFGIFLGAAIWSAMYIKYRSIWPGYLSHAIVDLCVFAIGASMLF